MSNNSFTRPGYPTVTTGLNVKDPEAYIDWARLTLGAEPGMRFEGPDGKVVHAEICIGDTRVAVDRAARDPETTNALFHVYVPDVNAAYERATAAGAKSKMPPTDMFFGERVGIVADANDNSWAFATFLEALSPEVIQQRGAEFFAKQQKR
ncbi:MAG: VOC family protein [Myxococcales bacterium]|nr:VOC family protein [Myxococcales bacterium]